LSPVDATSRFDLSRNSRILITCLAVGLSAKSPFPSAKSGTYITYIGPNKSFCQMASTNCKFVKQFTQVARMSQTSDRQTALRKKCIAIGGIACVKTILRKM